MCYLTKRGKTYYFRTRIPLYIAKYLPSLTCDQNFARAEYVRSLRTDRRDIAKLRCSELLGKLSNLQDCCMNTLVAAEDKYPLVLEICYDGIAPSGSKPIPQAKRKAELKLSDLIDLYLGDKANS
ncbi:MAG: DUF6538 domain-containing protein [Desulfuromonadales bacterium]